MNYTQFLYGFLVSLGCGLLAFFARTISISGVIGGVIFGTIIYGSTGWQGFLVPLTFFVIGSLCTKIGYKKKVAMGIAQEEGGKRGAKHALANILAGTIFAVLSMIFYDAFIYHFAFYAAMIGSFATAAADTSSSELGQVYGKTTINPLTFKRVKPGTEGAVSVEGTIFGILAAGLVAIVGVSTGKFFPLGILSESSPLSEWPYYVFPIFAIVTGAFLGNFIEGIVGAACGNKFNNEFLNFLNTLIGGTLAGIIMYGIFYFFAGFYLDGNIIK